jgi:hypothetical protein
MHEVNMPSTETIVFVAVILAIGMIAWLIAWLLTPRGESSDARMRDPFGDWPHVKDRQ